MLRSRTCVAPAATASPCAAAPECTGAEDTWLAGGALTVGLAPARLTEALSSWTPTRASLGLLPLAQPVKEGSIHRARLSRGAVIPVHTHPADEYVMVLNGAVETGGRRCETGTFWITTCRYSARSASAVTDAELLIVVLARWGLSASKAAFIHSSNTGYC